MLAFPDPDRQFIVEVDASDTGIGAVLSQRSKGGPTDPPCGVLVPTFFPRGEELRRGKSGATGGPRCPGGVETLAGGRPTTRADLDGPQEPHLHQGGEETGSPAGALGSPVQPVQLHPHLPPRVQERSGGCSFTGSSR